MRIFLNDLCFDGRFTSRDAVRIALLALLQARSGSAAVRRVLYCSAALGQRQAYGSEMLQVSISHFPRDEKVRLLQWLNKNGPFLESDQEAEEHDLFWFKKVDVTDQGLGEATRRLAHGKEAAAHSVCEKVDDDFSQAALPVVHGLLEEPFDEYDVPNTWTIPTLIEVAEASELDPVNWGELIQRCRERFPRLIIGDHCLEILAASPFSTAIADRINELCRILNRIMEHMGDDGSLTPEGEEIKQTHFVGENANFSDEARSNKQKFAREMTFPDPSDDRKTITCFWHGKIRTQQFRIHFEWPPSAPREGLKVAYMGPKISKR